MATGPVLRRIKCNGALGEKLTQAGVWWLVKSYAEKLEIDIRPHDLRRTLAHLMRKAGAPIEQVQLTLGHASVKTTELYLGGKLEIGKGEAGVDRIRMEEA